jgi:hypothetical protein
MHARFTFIGLSWSGLSMHRSTEIGHHCILPINVTSTWKQIIRKKNITYLKKNTHTHTKCIKTLNDCHFLSPSSKVSAPSKAPTTSTHKKKQNKHQNNLRILHLHISTTPSPLLIHKSSSTQLNDKRWNKTWVFNVYIKTSRSPFSHHKP